MLVTKYGIDVVLKSVAALSIIGVVIVYVVANEVVQYASLAIVLGIAGVILNFFRDPERIPPAGENIVVSPADGKIIRITEIAENDYLKSDAILVSIFMSPLDVHVNRFPIPGIIEYFRHIEGEYLVAFDDKSSERNERTLIGVDDNGYKVLFKQIAGMVARRIVAPVTVGQQVLRGERFGMIKFGSRVDVIMPRPTEVRVHLHDHVVAGETILARYSAVRTAA